jgi:tetratricopeptide (TPR) repeat protein
MEDQHQQALRLAQSGRIDEAKGAFDALLAKDANDAEALHFFGVLAVHEEQAKKAVDFLTRAINARPEWAKAHNSLGCALQALGRDEEAATCFRHAVTHDPAAADSHYNLGTVLYGQGKLEEAVTALERALEIDPAMAAAHNVLSAALKGLDRLDAAESSARRAIELEPEMAEAYTNLGNAIRHRDNANEAESAYRRAIELAPDLGIGHGNLGTFLVARGNLDEGKQALRRSIALDPEHTEPYRMLSVFTDIESDQPLMDQMARIAVSPRLGPDQLSDIRYAQARAAENSGDHDQAFAWLNEASRLHRSIIDYDPESNRQRIDALIATIRQELVYVHRNSGNKSSSPIFILGFPRSGTTLVEQILASHSQVTAKGELPALAEIANKTGYPGALTQMDATALTRLGTDYLAEASAAPSAFFTDKMPSNFMLIGLIRLALPNARIIHCRRDAVDTCLSCYRIRFGFGQNYSYDLAELGEYYRDYHRLMDHWRTLFPGAILDIDYEDVVADQQTQTRRLLEFCGLAWEDACLRFEDTDRSVWTASATQVRKPIYTSAVGRWKKYERHLTPLLNALGSLVNGV